MKSLKKNEINTKHVLLSFTIIFMLTGIPLIVIGSDVITTYTDYDLLLEENFFLIPLSFIVIGSIVIGISFFGCWTALKEYNCLIVTFLVLLILILIAELTVGIMGFLLPSETPSVLNKTLTIALMKYSNIVNDETLLLDDIQHDYNCCGVQNYTDWKPYFRDELPISCCSRAPGTIGTFNCTANPYNLNLYQDGCLTYVSQYISAQANDLGTVATVVIALQLIIILFGCFIRWMMNKQYEGFEIVT